ncbi:chitinase [Ramicandelaber brevisporus]|nr:chitinase [Ramicandelaber brevisporus]
MALASSNPNNKVVVGYYPSWKSAALAAFDYTQVTHMQHAFAILQKDGSISFDGDWFMDRITKAAQAKGTKVTISVGGWTGSFAFSPVVASKDLRTKFIDNVVNFLDLHFLDGVDLDWEYPGRLGDNCNKFDKVNDAPNFLLLLKELRAALDKKFGTDADKRKIITLAIRVQPFDGPDGPIKDVRAYAEQVDFASIMAFDIGGGWSKTTAPLAPFRYERGKGDAYSVVQAVNDWLKAGWPASKLVLGVPFYGRSVTTTVDMSKDLANQYANKTMDVPHGDGEDAPWDDVCAGTGAVLSGVWSWKNMRSQGPLSGPTTAGAEWVRSVDPITKTPWLFNSRTNTYISYDDPDSLANKVSYADKMGLRGMMTWELHGDNNELLPVLNKIRSSTSTGPENGIDHGHYDDGSSDGGSGHGGNGGNESGNSAASAAASGALHASLGLGVAAALFNMY